MGRRLLAFAVAASAAILLLAVGHQAQTQETQDKPSTPAAQTQENKDTPPAPPSFRKIPGITADDAFPGGCVSCHVKLPDRDVRISTILKEWATKVPAEFLERIKGAAPKGMTLKGKHPDASFALKDIPKSCMMCHGAASKMAPPMQQMTHLIHLTGGEKNHFLTGFQGECTHCHKMNATTGMWTIPSGPEK